ncbi:MAG: rhamnogalacturonan lyase [Verrucomicrobiota bacterium]
MAKSFRQLLLALCLLALLGRELSAQRFMENLGRGVVAINEGPLFSERDLLDVHGLVRRLQQRADAPSRFLVGRLSDFSMQALTNRAVSTPALAEMLVNDLNTTVQQGESIYSARLFTNVTLTVGIERLRTNTLNDAGQVIRLNRQLLSALFPRELKGPGGDKVFISWRLLGDDPEGIAFNVYRATGNKAFKLNASPLVSATWFIDENPQLNQETHYFVRPVINGRELPPSRAFTLKAGTGPKCYLSVPLQVPPGCTPNDGSVADLDGDGEFEIVLKLEQRPRDNSGRGLTGETRLQAYKLDGTLLWTINLGRNIREGAHYTPFIAFDLDGDGRAEVACKTGDGTVDGKGRVIGDATADHRNADGHVLKGPEYFTVFDGLTGAALATTNYLPPRHAGKLDPTHEELQQLWGDGNGNRSERYLAGVACLDGRLPSVIMCRGYYTRTTLAAWDWRDGRLSLRWLFDSDDGTPGNREYRGQGNHNLTVADVDGDGRDEIIYGACTIDDDGKGLYSTRIGHADALHVSDLNPEHPGLEVFDIQERFSDAGANFRDARTGEVLWKKPSVQAGEDGEGPARGCALNIDPRYPGSECWVFGAGIEGLFNADGEKIGDVTPPSCNFGVWWDGDLLRELLDRNYVAKWNWMDGTETPLLTAVGCVQNNGTKATPVLSADLFGDWREEVVWRTRDNRELRIYTTSIPTRHRLRTLMHDPQYRLSIAWQNAGYNQPPHTSFYVGEGMPPPPRPAIQVTPRH